MAYTRVLQQQGQPQHSWQWGPEGPRSTGRSGGSASSGHDVAPCRYRILTGPGAGTTCWSPDHSASRYYRRLDDLHRACFGPHAITPHWPSRLCQRIAAPVESHLPGLGPFPAARVETCVSSLGACVVSSPSASERLCVGAAAATSLAPAFVAGSGATSQTAQLSLTLDSGASSCFFRDCTDLTPLRTPVTVALGDPSVGPVVAHSTTTLPCPAAPSGFLIGYYSPSFSKNLVGVSHLHDLGVVTTFPPGELVASCTVVATGTPLATFHREPGSGLLESLAPLPRSPAPPCTPCVEGRQRAAPHSSSFPPHHGSLPDPPLGRMGPLPGPWPTSHPHRGTEVFPPPLFLTLEPPPVAPVAPPPSRPAPSGVSHVTPQSSPPQRPVPVVSGGAGGAVAEGEGTGAGGAGGVSSGGAGVVGMEVTPVEDTAALSRRPRPASPPGFPSVPQFPPRSSLRPVAAEPGGVPAGGTGGPRGVGGGGARSRGAGAGGIGTVAPTPRTVRFLTREQCLLLLEREEHEWFERA
ncbi:unnamed protein product [Closterium sp. NIES-54]